MVDVFDKTTRSRVMSAVGSKNTWPELFVRNVLHDLGYRYRLHVKDLPGNPDIANKTRKKAIFVNGCFWHGHLDCTRAKLPATNTAFWESKIDNNRSRDRKNIRSLEQDGFGVLVVWQCELKDDVILASRLLKFWEERTNSA